TLDGLPPEQATARPRVLASLEATNAQPTRYNIAVPSNNLDVDANQELLYEALVACRRHGVELLVTGTADCRLDDFQRLYYDEYFFFATDITLKLIDVQNGRVLRTAMLSRRGNHVDEETAARLS